MATCFIRQFPNYTNLVLRIFYLKHKHKIFFFLKGFDSCDPVVSGRLFVALNKIGTVGQKYLDVESGLLPERNNFCHVALFNTMQQFARDKLKCCR